MKLFTKTLLFVFLAVASNSVFAKQVEMADGMRADGKIYVVVVMILLILAGFITYLFMLDRKLNKMEKQLREREQTKR